MANFYFYFRILAAGCLALLLAAVSMAQARQSKNVRTLLPVSFEVNRGQVGPDIDFVAHPHGYSAYIGAGGITLSPTRSRGSQQGSEALVSRISLVGANVQPNVQSEGALPGYSNFLFGSDPHKWITSVTQYAKVRYANVYPGIDIVYHGNEGSLENDFIVLPGSDARQITFRFAGTQKPHLTKRGELVLRVGDGEFRLRKPQAYQLIAGRKVEIEAAYLLSDRGVHFQLGRYKTTSTLIIDPVLAYSTFLGGAFGPNGGFQIASAVAVDADGNLYVTGNTDSTSFPVTPGVVDSAPATTFVSKLNPAGTALIYSTYIAGMRFSGQFSRSSMALDASGNVYIGGFGDVGLPIPAGSTPFRATPSSFAVLKINSTGTAVLAGTYLGGSDQESDLFGGLAVDSAGSVYLTGTTSSADFPTHNPLQAALGASGENAFVTKLNPAMSGLVFSTYLGGDSKAASSGIALDGTLNAYIAGSASPGFPTTAGAFQTIAPLGGPILAELNSAGSSLLYATYLAGTGVAGYDFGGGRASAVAVDDSGNAFLMGSTPSIDFPVVNPIQSCPANGSTFLSEFSPAGTLLFSSCFGNNSTVATAMALDSQGNVYIAGFSDTGLPLKNPIDSNPLGNRPFIAEISPATPTLLFSTFVAGSSVVCCDGSGDHVNAIAVDASGNIYAVGDSGTYGTGISGDLPQQSGDLFPIFNALQPLFPNTDGCDNKYGCAVYAQATVIKISPQAGASAAVAPSQMEFSVTQPGSTAAPGTITVYDLGTDPLTVSNVTVDGDFDQTNNCGAVPQSGGACAILVTFTPKGPGLRTGVLTITDSSAGSPHTIPLTGTGAFGFTLAASPSSAAVSAGGSATFNLLVTTDKSFTATMNFNCTGAPVASTCNVTPNELTLIPGSSESVPVVLTTTAHSTARASAFGQERLISRDQGGSLFPLSNFLLLGVLSPALWLAKRRGWRCNFKSGFILLFISMGGIGCGGGGSTQDIGTPSGTYNIVVTGTSGSITKSATFTLTVR